MQIKTQDHIINNLLNEYVSVKSVNHDIFAVVNKKKHKMS